MTADRELWEGGPEGLRPLLEEWPVPAPSPEVEERLRRAFRRRHVRRRRAVGLVLAASAAVAASLAVLAVLAPRAAGPVQPPARVGEQTVPPPSPPLPLVPETRKAASRASVKPTAVRATRTGPARRPDDDVLVEPGQAALLLQLGGQLQGIQQGGFGLSLPRIEGVPADAPSTEIRKAQSKDQPRLPDTRWEKVQGTWPFVHWSL